MSATRTKIKNAWIALVFLIPVSIVIKGNYPQARQLIDSKWPQALTGGDQHGIYFAFKECLEGRIPDAIKNGWLPTGYLSLLGFYHKISRVWTIPSPEASFVYHGLFYSVVAVFLCVLLSFRVALTVEPKVNRVYLALGCVGFWVAALKLTTVLSFVWLPWSHYACSCVGIFFIFSLFEVVCYQLIRWYFLCAFAATLFLLSRPHEAMAVFVGSGIVVCFQIFLKILEKGPPFFDAGVFRIKSTQVKKVVAGVCGGVFALKFITFFSNGMPFSFQYIQQAQSNSYVHEYLKLYPQMIPLRFIQTFFYPNFYSYSASYYIKSIYHGRYEIQDFQMPLIFQLPFLWYLVPLAFICAFCILRRFLRKDYRFLPVFFLFGVGALSFCVMVCGYLATATVGGWHLRTGLIREFILCVLLLSVGCGPGVVFFLAREFKKPRFVWQIPILGIFLFAFIFGQKVLKHLPEVGVSAKRINPKSGDLVDCQNGKCTVQFDFRFENGQKVNPPFEHSIVNFYCPTTGEAGLTRIGQKIQFDIIPCPLPVKVEVYPLFMGICGSGSPYLKFFACSKGVDSPQCTKS